MANLFCLGSSDELCDRWQSPQRRHSFRFLSAKPTTTTTCLQQVQAPARSEKQLLHFSDHQGPEHIIRRSKLGKPRLRQGRSHTAPQIQLRVVDDAGFSIVL